MQYSLFVYLYCLYTVSVGGVYITVVFIQYERSQSSDVWEVLS